MPIADLAKRLGIPNQGDVFEDLYGVFGYGKKVQVETTKGYFDNSGDANTADVIVGVSLTNLDDGEVSALKDILDASVQKDIEAKIGPIGKLKLKTFVQFVSNDNY